MGYKLFLDDVRNPVHCITYMHLRIGRLNPIYLENEWVIARTFESFKNTIESMGLPDFISFDHDLALEHCRGDVDLQSYEGWEEYHSWGGREETGYDCAKWLVNYCMDHKKPIPKFAIHSMNPVGIEKIHGLLKNAEKWTTKNGSGS